MSPTWVFAVGPAAFYLWMVAAVLRTPVIHPVQRWLRRGWRRPLVACGYCSGFWLSGAVTGALWAAHGFTDPVVAASVWLAGAALCGFMASWTDGIADEDEVA